jgi:hypothetical protein
MLALFVIANAVIALSYIITGIYITGKFYLPLTSRENMAFKVSASVFFLMCAMTHIEQALHGATNTPMDYTAFHMLAIHVLQAVAAPIFVLTFLRGWLRDQEWDRNL